MQTITTLKEPVKVNTYLDDLAWEQYDLNRYAQSKGVPLIPCPRCKFRPIPSDSKLCTHCDYNLKMFFEAFSTELDERTEELDKLYEERNFEEGLRVDAYWEEKGFYDFA